MLDEVFLDSEDHPRVTTYPEEENHNLLRLKCETDKILERPNEDATCV